MNDIATSRRDPDCLFCRIATGDLAADLVFADDDVVAFRDINPQAPTHVLLVPTGHVTDASALGLEHAELLAHLFSTAASVARREGLAGGYRLVFNVGDDAGNTVAHLHLHLLGGRSLAWPPG